MWHAVQRGSMMKVLFHQCDPVFSVVSCLIFLSAPFPDNFQFSKEPD
jgi:hypothetical protein